MTTSTDVYWSVLDDAGLDVPLQTYAYNIDTWGGDKQSVPSLRGSDVTIPFAPGDYWVAKQPDSRTISLGMWVIGATESGNIPASGSSRQVFEENWRALRKLLWTPGRQITLIKRFRDFDTGAIIVAKALAQFSGGLTPTMNGTQRAQFVVQLNLADPFFYGEEEEIEYTSPGTTAETIKGDADTTKISITLNGPITNFEMKNNSQNKILSLTYSKEVDSTPVLIDIPKFSSFEGATKTTGYIDNLGDNFWMILRSGVNNITVDYDGAGSVVLKYKPAYF